MSEPSKLPFDPIPVGPSTASLGLGDPPRPSFSRSVQEIPTNGLLPPSRKPVAVSMPNLPLGIAPEAHNPLAGSTPPPKASGGLLWDLIRPTRGKGAVLAAVVSLAAGAYGLNLVAPTPGPTARQPLGETPPTTSGTGPKVEVEGIAPPKVTLESSMTLVRSDEPIPLPPLNPKSLEVIPLPPSGGFGPVNNTESMPLPKPTFGGFKDNSTESVPLPPPNFGPSTSTEQVPLPKVTLEPVPLGKSAPLPNWEEKPGYTALPPVPKTEAAAPLPIPGYGDAKKDELKSDEKIIPIPAPTSPFREAAPTSYPPLEVIPKTAPKIVTIGDVTPSLPIPSAPVPSPSLTITPGVVAPVGFSTPKTDFECDVVKVKKNDSYVAISEKFYQTRKYAAALKTFNQNADINQMTEVYVPPMHEIRKYGSTRDAEPEARPSVRGPVLENPIEPSDSVEWGAAGKKRATVRNEKYTTPREGMTAREVAKAVYDDEREWSKLTGPRGAKLKADDPLPRGTEITVPREDLPWK